MSDSRQDKIDSNLEQFKDAVLSSKKLGTDRYEYLKDKKSQGDGTCANVVIIHDKGTGVKFTIAVNVSATIKKPDAVYTTDDRIDQIQDAVTEFLINIHEKL